jgi:ataxia telangiectasia mutated family protein
MEQVFDLVNKLLRRDRETKRRDLRVRGYVIIPLSNQAGLLEFIGNTSPLREWLSRAHIRYGFLLLLPIVLMINAGTIRMI